MLKKGLKLVVTFFTSSDAMACEKECKNAGIEGKLISAPRELTSDCGISYKTDIENKTKLEELFKVKNIEYDKINEINIY